MTDETAAPEEKKKTLVLFGYATGEKLDKIVPPGIGRGLRDAIALYAYVDFSHFQKGGGDEIS